MLTNTELKTVIVQNLNDQRLYSLQRFLTDLIERKTHGGGIPQYRITNTLTNQPVTSLTDLIDAIHPASMKPEVVKNADALGGDRLHPFRVILDNLKVTVNRYSAEDQDYFVSGKEDLKIALYINYLSDADPDLPLKVFSFRLI